MLAYSFSYCEKYFHWMQILSPITNTELTVCEWKGNIVIISLLTRFRSDGPKQQHWSHPTAQPV